MEFIPSSFNIDCKRLFLLRNVELQIIIEGPLNLGLKFNFDWKFRIRRYCSLKGMNLKRTFVRNLRTPDWRSLKLKVVRILIEIFKQDLLLRFSFQKKRTEINFCCREKHLGLQNLTLEQKNLFQIVLGYLKNILHICFILSVFVRRKFKHHFILLPWKNDPFISKAAQFRRFLFKSTPVKLVS